MPCGGSVRPCISHISCVFHNFLRHQADGCGPTADRFFLQRFQYGSTRIWIDLTESILYYSYQIIHCEQKPDSEQSEDGKPRVHQREPSFTVSIHVASEVGIHWTAGPPRTGRCPGCLRFGVEHPTLPAPVVAALHPALVEQFVGRGCGTHPNRRPFRRHIM